MHSTGLRWALVFVPALVIASFDYVRHVIAPEVLHTWPGSVMFMALVVGGSILITEGVFRVFARHRRSLLWLAGELSALGAIATGRASTQPEVLEPILDRVLRSLPADAAAIYLREHSGGALRRAAALGAEPAISALPEQVATGEVTVCDALRTVGVTLCDSFPTTAGGSDEPRHLAALVPLRSRDAGLGLMVLVGNPRSALRDNLDLLAVLGSQVAVIVDNISLFQETQKLLEQSRHLAVLEERDRLAREMHDSLAQVLGLVGIKARVIQELINRREYARAADEAADVSETADVAYADVREAILGLRGSVDSRGLVGTLGSYLQQFGRQSGLRTKLVVQPDAVTQFAPAAETQLIRVVQEALTNVRKHARASAAVVSFGKEDGWARIVVEDDGQGFDPSLVASANGQGFGLQTMAERVEELGGRLAVESQPGRGTRVVVRLPAEPEEPRSAVALYEPAEPASA